MIGSQNIHFILGLYETPIVKNFKARNYYKPSSVARKVWFGKKNLIVCVKDEGTRIWTRWWQVWKLFQVVMLWELERSISLDMFWAFFYKKACQYAPLNENISKDILNAFIIFSWEDL